MIKLTVVTLLVTMNVLKITNMWHYISTEDMQWFKEHLPKPMYWKLSAQCRKRVPMLKSVYKSIKKRYDKLQN